MEDKTISSDEFEVDWSDSNHYHSVEIYTDLFTQPIEEPKQEEKLETIDYLKITREFISR